MSQTRPHLQTSSSPSTAYPQHRTLTPQPDPTDEQFILKWCEHSQPSSPPDVMETLALSCNMSTPTEFNDSEESLPLPDVAAKKEEDTVSELSPVCISSDSECVIVDEPIRTKKDSSRRKRRAKMYYYRIWRPRSSHKKKKMSASRERTQSASSNVLSESTETVADSGTTQNAKNTSSLTTEAENTPGNVNHNTISSASVKAKGAKSILNTAQEMLVSPMTEIGICNDNIPPRSTVSTAADSKSKILSVLKGEERLGNDSGTSHTKSTLNTIHKIDSQPLLIEETKISTKVSNVGVINVPLPHIRACRQTLAISPAVDTILHRQPLYQSQSQTARLLRSVAVQTSMNWYHIIPLRKETAACSLRELVNVAFKYERNVWRQNLAKHNSGTTTIHFSAVPTEISIATTSRSAETDIRWFELVTVLDSPGRRYYCRVILSGTKTTGESNTTRESIVTKAQVQHSTRSRIELVTTATQCDLQATTFSMTVDIPEIVLTSNIAVVSENKRSEAKVCTRATQTQAISMET